jgi:hypothetical protein
MLLPLEAPKEPFKILFFIFFYKQEAPAALTTPTFPFSFFTLKHPTGIFIIQLKQKLYSFGFVDEWLGG